MNEKQIKAELLILAKDMQDLPAGAVVKEQADKLLTHDNQQGGVLVQWFNREQQGRTRTVLRRVIKLTVKAYQGNYTGDDGIELQKLCERLNQDPPTNNLKVTAFERHYDDVHASWSGDGSPPHKHIAKTFYNALSATGKSDLIKQHGNAKAVIDALAKKSENLRAKRKRESLA